MSASRDKRQEVANEPARPASVAVVIPTYNDVRFLADAIESVLAQSRAADEIIVVDDGSSQDPGPVVARYPQARLVRQANQGLAGARNTGLRETTCEAVIFLDADDRLLPSAVADGLDVLQRSPGAGFAFGGWRFIRETGEIDSSDIVSPATLAYRDLLRGNRIGMHGTVTYRTAAIRAAGGFDTSLRRCEDYDLYLRMALEGPIATHAGIAAEYRKHGTNMSRDPMDMLSWALRVHDRHEERAKADPELAEAWRQGREHWTNYYTSLRMTVWDRAKRKFKHLAPKWLSRGLVRLTGRRPPTGLVDLGDLSRTRPIADDFGYERGTPIDRGYIEDFLDRCRQDIRGRVLEVGDDAYSRRFGGVAVTRQDVLHIDSAAAAATIVGDLGRAGLLPKSAFDCLVLTQTLHLVWDMRAAVGEIHRSLKPGGVALVTVPGISRIDRGEWGRGWFWSLTAASARRLFAEAFGEANVEVEHHGNVYAATLFLQGLALEEADRGKLAETDPCFPVILAVRAVKQA